MISCISSTENKFDSDSLKKCKLLAFQEKILIVELQYKHTLFI